MSSDPARSSNAVEYYVDRHAHGPIATKPAFLSGGQELTYEGLFRASCRAGNVFRAAGLARGNRVLFILPDSLTYAAAFYGVLRIGAVAVPLSPRLCPREYEAILSDCRPAALVTSRECLSLLEPLAAASSGNLLPQRIWLIDPEAAAAERSLVAQMETASERCPTDQTDACDMALIQYTSGSTGTPKGVIHPQRGILNVSSPIVQRFGLRETDIFLSAAKLCFGYGLGNSMFFPLSIGATAVLVTEPADPYAMFLSIANARTTVFFGMPSLYARMLKVHDTHPGCDVGSLRLCVSAGESLPKSVLALWQARFGLEIVEGLGSTECLHIYLANEPGRVKPGSVGRPVSGYELSLRDENSIPGSPNEPRMLYIRSDCCAQTYWNKPKETARAMNDGWVRSGDYFTTDQDGDYFFVGRGDDVIKVGGLKVSPIEIEETILNHDAVRECAVISVPDSQGINIVIACVCLQHDVSGTKALQSELRRYLEARVSKYKVPAMILFVTDLPRTSTGKISRAGLRATGLAALEQTDRDPRVAAVGASFSSHSHRNPSDSV